jgi:hypothetical protein
MDNSSAGESSREGAHTNGSVDADFIEALPADIKAEVLQYAALFAEETTPLTRENVISSEYLNTLTLELREEVLANSMLDKPDRSLKPISLPVGWTEEMSLVHKTPYYVNKKKGITTWQHPGREDAPEYFRRAGASIGQRTIPPPLPKEFQYTQDDVLDSGMHAVSSAADVEDGARPEVAISSSNAAYIDFAYPLPIRIAHSPIKPVRWLRDFTAPVLYPLMRMANYPFTVDWLKVALEIIEMVTSPVAYWTRPDPHRKLKAVIVVTCVYMIIGLFMVSVYILPFLLAKHVQNVGFRNAAVFGGAFLVINILLMFFMKLIGNIAFTLGSLGSIRLLQEGRALFSTDKASWAHWKVVV